MEYLLKASAIVMIFYFFYKIFLEKETFFQPIRIYLQIGLISSLLIPLIEITKYKTVEPLILAADLTGNNTDISAHSLLLTWDQILVFLYFAGVVFFGIRFLFQLVSVFLFISKHKAVRNHKYKLINTDRDFAPFSFFNTIVLNRSHYSEIEIGQILKHENVHADQKHSIDILLSQLLNVILWFNPFVWLYNKEIQKNLEFIADEQAQYFSKEKKNYQYLLLKSVSPEFQRVFTSNFYNSLIKKRIDMLQKNRSNNKMQYKFALIIPVLTAFIFIFNTRVIAQQKTINPVKSQTGKIIEVINKDFSKHDLDLLKNRLAAEGITLKIKGVKYNKKNEIIAIKLEVRNKNGNESRISQNSTVPIQPIQIEIDKNTGAMRVGNIALHEAHQEMYFTSDDGKQRTFIVKKIGDSGITVTSGNSKNGKNVIFIDEDGKEKTIQVTVNSDTDLADKDGNGKTTTVWVTNDGKTKNAKEIKVIKIDEESDGSHKMIIQTDGDSDNNEFIFISDDEIDASNISGGQKIKVYSSSGKKPLYFMDGKKISEDEMKDIDPDKIKSMNVFKGESAIKKYGKKGADGVIEITTKK